MTVSRPATSPQSTDNRSTPKIYGPAWGKLIDPTKQRRWWLLLREREGRLSPAEVDSIAWARRSYTLSYAPVFQDARSPGECLSLLLRLLPNYFIDESLV